MPTQEELNEEYKEEMSNIHMTPEYKGRATTKTKKKVSRAYRVVKTRSKFWVLSILINVPVSYGGAYSKMLAICKTKKEAEKLRKQKEDFRCASIDSVYLHQNNY